MSDKKMFMSSLAPFFKEYVAPRYLKGTCPSIIINALRSLDRFLVSSGYDKDYLLQDEYDKWAKTLANLSPMTIYTYKCSLINFLQFMNRIGHESFVPIRPKYPASDFVPYIFSHAEMERIFKCLDGMRVRPKRSTTVLMVMPAIIRMLYSTGIRIGEALTLRNRDVDFKRRILILNDTKNNCQRFAPINKSLEGVLKRYVKYRDKMPVKGAKSLDGFFFISYRGKPISHGNVYDTFIKVLKAAGIERMSNHKGPNLHSIRHTACMHALKKLVDSGVDMYCGLPIKMAKIAHPECFRTKVTPHVLRHSRAVHWQKGGVDLVYIRDLMGHVSIQTTEIYAKVDSKAKHDALANAWTCVGVNEPSVNEWENKPKLLAFLEQFGKTKK